VENVGVSKMVTGPLKIISLNFARHSAQTILMELLKTNVRRKVVQFLTAMM
jgi:hypothetical protein